MNSGGNLWENSAKEAFQGPELAEKIDVDFAVIGGGYTGLSAALAAANQGASVAVVESATIGFGGSGRNVGLVNAGLWLPPETVCKTMEKSGAGQGAGTRLNQALAVAPQSVFDLINTHAIDCEATRNGTLHYAHAPSGMANLADRHRQLQALGAPVTLLDVQQAQARVGSARVYGALHDACAGTIQPLSYALGLARAAQTAGAQVFTHTRAISVQHSDNHWRITTPKGAVRAQKLLIATNAYHQTVSHTDVPAVTKVNFFQLATDPIPADLANTILPMGEGCWDTAPIMTSFRKDTANRLIIGGMGLPDAMGLHHGWARRAIGRLFPQLSGVDLSHAWSGKISMTPDHIPKLLRVGPNGYAMFGYSGRGIGPGTVMGQAIAKALIDETEIGLPLSPIDHFSENFTMGKTMFYESAARLWHAAASWF